MEPHCNLRFFVNVNLLVLSNPWQVLPEINKYDFYLQVCMFHWCSWNRALGKMWTTVGMTKILFSWWHLAVKT